MLLSFILVLAGLEKPSPFEFLDFSSICNDDVSDITAQLLRDAPKQWAEIVTFSNQLQGTIRTSIANKSGNFSFNDTISQNTRFYNKIVEYDNTNHPAVRQLATQNIMCFGCNDKYKYQLVKNTGSDQWILAGVERWGRSEKPEERNYSLTLYALFDLYNTRYTLQDLIKQPHFKIAGGEIQSDGKARVSFNNHNPISAMHDRFPIWDGVVVFDTKRKWCLVSSDINFKYDIGIMTVKKSISYSASDMPIPIGLIETITSSYSDDIENKVMAFNLSKPSTLPEDAVFSLERFGIPLPHDRDIRDPDLGEPAPPSINRVRDTTPQSDPNRLTIPMFVISGGLGIVLLVLGLWLRNWASKPPKNQAANTSSP